jgi:hypothetical protein
MNLLMPDQPLDQTIRDNAQGPAEAHGDSGGSLSRLESRREIQISRRAVYEDCPARRVVIACGGS